MTRLGICIVIVVMAATLGGLAIAQEPPVVADSVRASLEAAAIHLRLGQADLALAALDRVEAHEPENPWLWYHRGEALLQLGNPYGAMAALDRAAGILADLGQPDPELSDAIARRRISARRQVFAFSVRLGLAYDTNVSFLGGGASSLGLVAGKADGKFGSNVRMDFAPVADEQQSFTFGGRLGHAWHFAIDEFDWQDYGAYVQYRRTLGGGFDVGLRYDYDMAVLGNESYLSQHALSPAITYRWPRRAGAVRLEETRVSYRFEARDFLFGTDPILDRDGYVHGVGVEQRLRVAPFEDVNWACDVGVGYLFQKVATDGEEFDRRTHDIYLSLDMPLLNPATPEEYLILPDKPLRLRLDASWQIARHRNPSVYDIDRNARHDLVTSLGLTLSQTLIEDPKIGDLVLHMIVHWTDAWSGVTMDDRIEPFTYDKVVYGIQLEWSW